MMKFFDSVGKKGQGSLLDVAMVLKNPFANVLLVTGLYEALAAHEQVRFTLQSYFVFVSTHA
jgi:hypothetical protein